MEVPDPFEAVEDEPTPPPVAEESDAGEEMELDDSAGIDLGAAEEAVDTPPAPGEASAPPAPPPRPPPPRPRPPRSRTRAPTSRARPRSRSSRTSRKRASTSSKA